MDIRGLSARSLEWQRIVEIASGVAQRSIIRTHLDKLLTLNKRKESLGKQIDSCSWFQRCVEEIEAAILAKKRIQTLHPISMDELIVESKPKVKYKD